MPEGTPEDFNFSIKFGIGKKNEFNKLEGIYMKDLIEAGTATMELTFTEEEMDVIYAS